MASFADLYTDAIDTELGSNDSAVLFTTARRKHAVNEGLRQFADLTECLVRQSTVTVTSSGQEYNLNATTVIAAGDFVRVAAQAPVYQTFDSNGSLQMSLAGDEDFPQRDVQWLDAADNGWRSTSLGTPSAWYLRRDGGALYFGLDCPADVSSNETAQLIIPYVPKPSSMTSDTDVPFTLGGLTRNDLEPYHQGLVHYAAHKLEKLRKDMEASDRQLQAFLGYVQRYIQATRPKGPRAVRTAKSYFKDSQRSHAGDRSRLAAYYR